MAEFAPSSEVRPLDTPSILRALDTAAVAYVLIGGVACIALGVEQVTYDADVLPALEPDNLQRLLHALNLLDASLFVDEQRMRFEDGEPWEVTSLRRGVAGLADAQAWHFTTSAGSVDVVMSAAGVGAYDAHVARATPLDVLGVRVLVAGVDDLIRSKESLGRDKDLMALPQLRRIRDES